MKLSEAQHAPMLHAKAKGQNTETEPNPILLAESRFLQDSKRILPHIYENVASISFLNFFIPSQSDFEILSQKDAEYKSLNCERRGSTLLLRQRMQKCKNTQKVGNRGKEGFSEVPVFFYFPQVFLIKNKGRNQSCKFFFCIGKIHKENISKGYTRITQFQPLFKVVF